MDMPCSVTGIQQEEVAMEPARLPASEKRSLERCRAHYEVEKELAERLRSSPRETRLHLYSSVYDEMYRRVLDHPMLIEKENPVQRLSTVRRQLRMLEKYLSSDSVFMEIGAGDCMISREVARIASKVYAIEISEEIARSAELPPNADFILSDGIGIPVPERTVTIAMSDQLMEHLHPDDASDQLAEIYRALAPGGLYVCMTPNRLNGPHDISKYFGSEPVCFHLKEYSFCELTNLFHEVGFSRIQGLVGARGRYLATPVIFHRVLETLFGMLPQPIRSRLGRTMVFRALLGVKLVAWK
jgi:SAM-dependent methyltransferase